MSVVWQKLGCDHDVSKFYSPPQVVKMAREYGMKGIVSLDSIVPANDGYVWDFPQAALQRSRNTDSEREATSVPYDVARMHALAQHPKP